MYLIPITMKKIFIILIVLISFSKLYSQQPCHAYFSWYWIPNPTSTIQTVQFQDSSYVYYNLDSIISWNWTFSGCGITSTSNLQNPSFLTSPNCITIATLTITTANGCSNSYIDTIFYANNPCQTFVSPVIVPSFTSTCTGSITLVSSQTNLNYQWNNGVSGNMITNLCAGSYFVTVTNTSQNCFNVFNYYVSQIPDTNNNNNCNYIINGTITPVSTPGGADGSITANVVNPGTINLPYTYIWNTGDSTQSITGLAQGLYTVTVYSPTCVQGVERYFYVYEVNTTLDSTLLGYLQNLMDTCLNFIPSQYLISSYQLLNNNSIIVTWLFTSSTGTTQTITSQYYYTFTNGVYYIVLIINCNNAKSTLGFGSYLKIENMMGINQNDFQFKFYPNPAYDKIIIESIQTPYEYSIFDLSGRTIMQAKVSENMQVVDLQSWSTGAYLIQFKTDKGIKNKKLMIVR